MTEKRALQFAIALAGLVPVSAGGLGAVWPEALSLAGRGEALSHLSYLSGLLLGLGLAFWSTIPSIEQRGRMFGMLAAIVTLGGLARLALAARLGVWGLSTTLPLVMELGVTPALWLWQRRISHSFNSSPE